MSCMILVTQPTMATTRLVRPICCADSVLEPTLNDGGTPAAQHELGRGHRRKWQAAAPHALDCGTGKLTVSRSTVLS
jgi:hypothetical protein